MHRRPWPGAPWPAPRRCPSASARSPRWCSAAPAGSTRSPPGTRRSSPTAAWRPVPATGRNARGGPLRRGTAARGTADRTAPAVRRVARRGGWQQPWRDLGSGGLQFDHAIEVDQCAVFHRILQDFRPQWPLPNASAGAQTRSHD
ncbi:hypothetical protein G6F63_015190 [Rhizopus arrhizus]|nr:hypothetical protein G6F63_015190 [Rhizopus arrhizus]